MQGRSFSSPVVGKFCPHAVEKFCLPYGLPSILKVDTGGAPPP